ncbi:MAG: low molecular weight protein-tyrosine-phosphatase [Leptothrix sp. (in: b-proteobacteria)]
MRKVRVLMVCMGNICRSPTAEAVLRHRVQRAGLARRVEIDSAGTYAGHVGSPPDERSTAHAARRGYDLTDQRARRVASDDFSTFDLLLAMDDDNYEALLARCPAELKQRVRRLMDFAPPGSPSVVPDPYYGGTAGFEYVLDLIELACDGLVQYLHSHQGAVFDCQK